MALLTLLIKYIFCLIGMIVVIPLAVDLLVIFLIVFSALVHDDLIKILGTQARDAIDQSRHEYLDRIYSEQLHQENKNEQL